MNEWAYEQMKEWINRKKATVSKQWKNGMNECMNERMNAKKTLYNRSHASGILIAFWSRNCPMLKNKKCPTSWIRIVHPFKHSDFTADFC